MSYQLLTPELQRLWCLLSVFPADFDLLGAAAVWEMEQIPAEDALGELVKWSLVDFLPSATGEGGRYRLHDLARDFAESRLEADAREYYAAEACEALSRASLEGKRAFSPGGRMVFQGAWHCSMPIGRTSRPGKNGRRLTQPKASNCRNLQQLCHDRHHLESATASAQKYRMVGGGASCSPQDK